MKAIIVDDESKSRQVLRMLLQMECPEVEVAGEAGDIPSGVKLIEEINPELVFLDISLKDGDSFQLLERLPVLNFKTAFITAYDEYSVRALQFAGVPCMHKPVDTAELGQIVKQLGKQATSVSVCAVRDALQILQHRFEALPVRNEAGRETLLPLSDLIYVEAWSQGSLYVTSNGSVFHTDKGIDAHNALLVPLGFIGGKHFCVNRKFITAASEDRLILSGGKTLFLKG